MNEISHGKFGVGASVLRKEDNAFVTGQGRYTDDLSGKEALRGYVLRSPYAHATFTINDITMAQVAPGVHLVLIAKDVAHLQAIKSAGVPKTLDGSKCLSRDIPILCETTVRHVGDAVAFIVADTVDQAKDASELIDIDFDMLETVIDTVGALEPDAKLVYEDDSKNLSFARENGDKQATLAAFKNADRITEITLINNRLISNYMETRACLAKWVDDENRFEITLGSQGVHGMQTAMAQIFNLPKEKFHVITPDVGGGFGTKVFPYREYPLCLFAAKELGRPIRWMGERTEHFISDAHGRDNVVTAKMAMDKNGKFLAIDVDLVAAMGAYLHFYGQFIPDFGVSMTTGLYHIPSMYVLTRGSYTHTVPTDAYRGAGRPEAAYLIERLVDKCAFEMDMAVDEIRQLNFIQPEQLPYTTPAGRMYDTGEFEEHMRESMAKADWDGFEARNEKAKAKGKFRGIGMSTYVEACAFAGSEPAFVHLKDDGTVELRIGTQSNGQGHSTAYSQLAADKLGLSYEDIDMRQGDTDELANGGGTGGSRSVPLGGVSVVQASEKLAEQIRKIAADQMEASSGDIELDEGKARIVGTDRFMTFADIAKASTDEGELKADGEFKQAEATYPNGTHICEVEIDPETGVTKVVTYTMVDDFGVTINPILLEGQVHGGIVQGIGQCLNERVVYDEDGQLLTASFMDYGMPRADNFPDFSFQTRNVPSTTNAMGMKGAGEAGTIAACPAVMNAVVDAVRRERGITHVDMPVTPSSMWELLNEE